jgi:uncharacterized protein YjbI with pentapeptide repeats
MKPEQTVRRIGRRLIEWWWTPLRIAGAAMLVLAILVGMLGYLNERGLLYLTETAKQILKYLSANVSTELASIAITILFVDALYQHRETEREKRRLILQMGSPDNAFALEAVRALRSNGWLYDGSLKGANLEGSDLQGTVLQDADLQEANLGGTNLQGVILTRANLQEAQPWQANLQEAYLVLANLRGAYLMQTDLRGAYLVQADLQGAYLDDANLQEAHLEDANLQGAHLENTNLQGSHLEGANLQEANLVGADLQEANLVGADLQEAKYNNATTWPEGFTPPPDAVNVDAETDVED